MNREEFIAMLEEAGATIIEVDELPTEEEVLKRFKKVTRNAYRLVRESLQEPHKPGEGLFTAAHFNKEEGFDGAVANLMLLAYARLLDHLYETDPEYLKTTLIDRLDYTVREGKRKMLNLHDSRTKQSVAKRSS